MICFLFSLVSGRRVFASPMQHLCSITQLGLLAETDLVLYNRTIELQISA